MTYKKDRRIVLTLDAGGTNFVFSAIQGLNEIIKPVILPSEGKDLDKCLDNITLGFQEVMKNLDEKPVAISFAFPGPADYKNGIIGDLANLQAFRGGVALGPMLKEIFGLPVFINNDGDLFAYGEAIAGFLPSVNKELKKAGSTKKYNNLLGVTLGTGFGGGIVRNNKLYMGDNSVAGEIWVVRNHVYPETFAEESLSIRAVLREYRNYAPEDKRNDLTPKDIYDIAKGEAEGNKQAAVKSFEILGKALGDALANAVTLLDGMIVVGGGLSGAYDLFIDSALREMNEPIKKLDGSTIFRLEMQVFDMEDEVQKKTFIKGEQQEIAIPRTHKKIIYDPLKRIGIGKSKLGTSRAAAIGAYAYALSKLK
jgi:glucokinase